MIRTFPGTEWDLISSEEAGFCAEELDGVHTWLKDLGRSRGWRVCIVRGGHLVEEWGQGLLRDEQISQASIDKSFISSLLGIAIREGKIAGLDALVADYFPEMLNIPPGEGPRPGRHAFEKDSAITFRQLAGQTSGYMKPDQHPGQQFHYQTYGINIITHSIAKVYGLYDSSDPDRLPGCRNFLDARIRDPIGASWDSIRFNFDHPPGARVEIFGNGFSLMATSLDMARAGWLWLNEGRWNQRQLIPADYLREAVKTNPDVLASEPEKNWKYGLAFWTNDHGKLWSHLPRDAFAAAGAGAMHVFVCPSLDLVVTQTPGPWGDDGKAGMQEELLMRIVDSLR